MHRILNGFKIPIFQCKSYFTQFIFIDKYLKFKEIEYFIHYIKFKMWLDLFYINAFIFNIETQIGR